MSGWRTSRLVRRRRRSAPRAGAPVWVAILALFAFGPRGLIPMGFEPADGTLAVVLCHEGFPAHFFSHGAPHGKRGAGERDAHCLFCGGSSPAPAFALPGIARIAPVSLGIVRFSESSDQSVRLAHIPQARAPPHLV